MKSYTEDQVREMVLDGIRTAARAVRAEGFLPCGQDHNIASRILARSLPEGWEYASPTDALRPDDRHGLVPSARSPVGLPVIVVERCGACPHSNTETPKVDGECLHPSIRDECRTVTCDGPPPPWCPLRSTPKPGGGQ